VIIHCVIQTSGDSAAGHHALESAAMDQFMLRPIGTLHTPWKSIGACPRNGRQPDPAPVCEARVSAEFVPGLQSLAGFSHLILLYWLGSASAEAGSQARGSLNAAQPDTELPAAWPPSVRGPATGEADSERPSGRKPGALAFTPPFDTETRGVFATRAPWRPNPIGLSVVAFDGFAGQGVLRVKFLDCVDGTPLLDIKPYLATTDSEPDASMGWLDPHATRNRNTTG
jgi:tRNA (adenine37-N6)-methyltransferase